jgi:hypothetical protein
MAGYRAYLLDKDDHITAYKPIEANSDAEALEIARQFVDGGYAVEVWLNDRKVGRLEH